MKPYELIVEEITMTINKFIFLGIIILYPILYIAFYFDNMSYKKMPEFYWLIVLMADIFTISFIVIVEHYYYKK